MNSKNKQLIRIGQMAKKAGVSAPTIKHYVNEGLLPAPVKTSRNMAYYDESCVDRIKLIKKLQKDKFLPLDVIKRIIDSGETIEEDLEMGKAILKTHKVPEQPHVIKESQIAKRTGYPMEKIRILESEGIIHPKTTKSGKEYDEVDYQIIELMKLREQIGVRFDYSVQTIRIYRDAIREAVKKDISLFAKDLAGDIPTQKAIKLLTEADETLNHFMVLYRHKMLNTLGEDVIKEVNALPRERGFLNLFPIPGNELPESPPKETLQLCFYYLCRGEHAKLTKVTTRKKRGLPNHDMINFSILADLLGGNLTDARSKVQKYMSKPSAYALNNAIAAMTYLFSINEAGGFSAPMFTIKKMLSYLKRIEKSNQRHVFSRDAAQFICGAIYIMLPLAVNHQQEGVDILSKLNVSSTRKKLEEMPFPEWLIRTIDYEILPEVDIRINRFLAVGYCRLGQHDKALIHLSEILAVSDPESEMAEWAGMQRLQLTQ